MSSIIIAALLIVALRASNRITRYPVLQHQMKCWAYGIAAFASLYSIVSWWMQIGRPSMTIIDWLPALLLTIITVPLAIISSRAFIKKFGFSPAK